MKSRLDAIWAAIGKLKDVMGELTKAAADYQSALTEATASAESLDTKIDRLHEVEAQLAAKNKELSDTEARLEKANAAVAKIKAAL